LGSWLPYWQAWVGHVVFKATSSDLAAVCARFVVAAATLLFVPAVLLGAAFPAALRLVVDAGQVGRDVGAVAAGNTVGGAVGGIVGSLATGFVLVPAVGLVYTLCILTVGATALGMLAILRDPATRRGKRWAAVGMALAAVLTVFVIPSAGLAQMLVAAWGGGPG